MRNAADRRRYGKAAHSLLPMEGGAPKGTEVCSLSGMKKWEAPLIGHGGKAATFSHKKTSHLLPRKDGLFFYNVRPISTAICLSLSGERPTMVR